MYRLLRFFYKNPSALTSLLLLPPQSRMLCGDPQYTLDVACCIHFYKSCRRAHSAASPLSQKVTLGSPVRLQAPSQRLTVATNFLRVFSFGKLRYSLHFVCLYHTYFVLSVLSAVLSKSGKIVDWNRWAIPQYLWALFSKSPDFMRVCGHTRLTETDRRNHVSNRRR